MPHSSVLFSSVQFSLLPLLFHISFLSPSLSLAVLGFYDSQIYISYISYFSVRLQIYILLHFAAFTCSVIFITAFVLFLA